MTLIHGWKPATPVEEAFAKARRIADHVGVPQEGFVFEGASHHFQHGADYLSYMMFANCEQINRSWWRKIKKAFPQLKRLALPDAPEPFRQEHPQTTEA